MELLVGAAGVANSVIRSRAQVRRSGCAALGATKGHVRFQFLAVILWHWRSYILEFDRAEPYDRLQARGAWFSFGLYLTVFVAGFLGPAPGLYIVASISIWLLFFGASEAWILLTQEEWSRAGQERRFRRHFTRWLKAARAQAVDADEVAATPEG